MARIAHMFLSLSAGPVLLGLSHASAQGITALLRGQAQRGSLTQTCLCFCTGHSLGGALATLAAYDLKGIAAKHSLDLQV